MTEAMEGRFYDSVPLFDAFEGVADEANYRPLPDGWLLAVAGLVFLMVVVGGITRLTESGLSITEWKPVSGAIPPLNAADWNHAFDLYKATPEYRQINGPAGMDLAAFKQIYFWEWLHRLLGRLMWYASEEEARREMIAARRAEIAKRYSSLGQTQPPSLPSGPPPGPPPGQSRTLQRVTAG